MDDRVKPGRDELRYVAMNFVYDQLKLPACARRTDLDQIAYVNGAYVPLTEAKVSILDRGFLFADGIYEVSAVLGGKLVDNDSHLARLQRSVGEIALPLPEPLERIVEIQRELIARNSLENGLVYIEVTRGADAGRDFAFPKGVKPTLVMFTSVKDIVNAPAAKTGIGVITVPMYPLCPVTRTRIDRSPACVGADAELQLRRYSVRHATGQRFSEAICFGVDDMKW